jgi:hypothetical protein
MLYDPKWDEPSMQGFLRFCESKPPEEDYYWLDGMNCAGAQYYRSLGRRFEWAMRIKHGFDSVPWQLDGAAFGTNTFGALAAHLRWKLHDQ